MKYLTAYKLFESNEGVIDNLKDIFIDYSDDVFDVSFHKTSNVGKSLSSYYTQLHNRADYKILVGLKLPDEDDEDYNEDEYLLGEHIDEDLVDLLERSIEYMDSIGYDYKIGYGWDGDTYTEGGVDMEDDLENIYDYEIGEDTFIGIYFFKKEENIQENKFDDSLRLAEETRDIRDNISDIFHDIGDEGFDIYISSSFHKTNEGVYQIRISRKDDGDFSFNDDISNCIERFIEYMEPYLSLIPAYYLKDEITFQIDHSKWTLKPEDSHNLSYVDLKRILNRTFSHKVKDDLGDGYKYKYSKVGDQLRAIYIQATVRLK